jgi:hypothetical protein
VNDLEPFKEALNPDLYEPTCRDSQRACSDFRNPEWAQMRTFG